MRTTVDLPDALARRVKHWVAERRTTFRELVILALEQALEEDDRPFRLRDASAGDASSERIPSEAINRAIDNQRDLSFIP
jgi:Arc/MetJ-type ribon-helix-helix transcriptional regulator